jgi:cytochrome c biogenesis factor
MSIGYCKKLSERDRLLQAYKEATGEEKTRILAKIAVLDEEIPYYTNKAKKAVYSLRKSAYI